MTLAALIALAVVLALILALDRLDQRHARAVEAWAEERAELLNRIQRPEMLPPPRAVAPRTESREPGDAKALAAVGTVRPLRDEE